MNAWLKRIARDIMLCIFLSSLEPMRANKAIASIGLGSWIGYSFINRVASRAVFISRETDCDRGQLNRYDGGPSVRALSDPIPNLGRKGLVRPLERSASFFDAVVRVL